MRFSDKQKRAICLAIVIAMAATIVAALVFSFAA